MRRGGPSYDGDRHAADRCTARRRPPTSSGTSTWSAASSKIVDGPKNYYISGEIKVYNPANIAQTCEVEDVLDDGTPVTVTCPSNTVAAGDTVTCTYEAFPVDDSATLNTVTITFAGNTPKTATAPVIWHENLTGSDSGNLTDPRFEYDEIVSASTTETFTETFACSTDPSRYTNGTYTEYFTNDTYFVNKDHDLHADAQVGITCTLMVPAGNQPAQINPNGTTILPSGRFLTPAGEMIRITNDPFGMAISPDGKKFFFLSYRPIEKGNKSGKCNIWVMDRTDEGWSKPKPLPSVVNSLDGIHWMLSVDTQGNLYFGTWKPQEDGKTTGDIYYSKYENGQYARPEKLGPEINVPGYKYSPFIASDELFDVQ